MTTVSDRGPIVSILKKPQMGKGPFQTNPGRNQKGIVATLEKMNKYQRAGHILEKLRNDTEQSKNFMDEIKNA